MYINLKLAVVGLAGGNLTSKQVHTSAYARLH